MKYKGRTEEGIRKMKERAYAQIGDPKALSRRRELHRLDPRTKMYSRARERCKITGVEFTLKSYKDIPKPYKCIDFDCLNGEEGYDIAIMILEKSPLENEKEYIISAKNKTKGTISFNIDKENFRIVEGSYFKSKD